MPRWGGMVEVGLISYPLYLWHWVLISFAYIYIGRQPNVPTLIGVVLASILFSYLTNKYVEILRYSKSKRVVAFLVAAAILASLCGLFFESQNGLAERSQLVYTEQYHPQFERIPEVDSTCSNYLKSLVGNRKIDYCRCTNPNDTLKKKIALIGDSHASVLFPGLSAIAKPNNYSVLMMANSSCPP